MYNFMADLDKATRMENEIREDKSDFLSLARLSSGEHCYWNIS